MENISLKQYITVGISSGVAITILLFILFSFWWGDIFWIWEEGMFALDTFLTFSFLGLIIGIILFFARFKLVNQKLLKYVFLSTICSVCIPSILFFALEDIEHYYAFLFAIIFIFSSLIGIMPPFGIIFILIILGVVYGLLINYFIILMERKTSKSFENGSRGIRIKHKK